jgi:hypothetical protein
MSDDGTGNGLGQSGEPAAREAPETSERTAKQSAHAAEESYSAATEGLRDMQLKLIDMAQANMNAMFEFTRQILTAGGPGDVVASWTAQGRKQFETLTAQANELTALSQKIASSSTAPIMQTARQAFAKGA